ncbi:MAG TPA: hypothetical protein PKX46_04040 [Clostridia bacterium]|nr:hypothetical protein [Clostridia bacterium]
MQKQQSARLKPRHILLCCVIGLAVLFGMAISQHNKLLEIAAEHTRLKAQYDALLLEEERVMRMLEYVHTDEYLKQYARERLGYLEPDDYKFYREDAAE